MTRFESLKAFKAVHGHTKVPQQWDDDPILFSWVFRQRKSMLAGTLSPVKRELLEGIGFADEENYFDTSWEEQFEKLVAFKVKFGHTRVPQLQSSLGRWVHEQVRREGGRRMEDEALGRWRNGGARVCVVKEGGGKEGSMGCDHIDRGRGERRRNSPTRG